MKREPGRWKMAARWATMSAPGNDPRAELCDQLCRPSSLPGRRLFSLSILFLTGAKSRSVCAGRTQTNRRDIGSRDTSAERARRRSAASPQALHADFPIPAIHRQRGSTTRTAWELIGLIEGSAVTVWTWHRAPFFIHALFGAELVRVRHLFLQAHIGFDEDLRDLRDDRVTESRERNHVSG